jgi:hypothetical protein
MTRLPRDKDFEDYLSAHFQCGGGYIERNIIERDVEEVLELDIISTTYAAGAAPSPLLIEAKSGGWGFGEIFKLLGWLQYLNIERGVLIVSTPKSNFDFYRNKALSIQIEIALIPDIESTSGTIANFVERKNPERIDLDTWMISHVTERKLLWLLKAWKKSRKEFRCFQQLESYYFHVNSEIFFTDNIIERAQELYSTYQQYRNISAKCGTELLGGSFDDESELIPPRIYEQTYYECKLNEMAVSTYIEQRARLAVLKSAIEYKIYEKLGELKRIEARALLLMGSKVLLTTFDALPHSFIEALEVLSTHKYFHCYPVFWQWFLWFFGGFILSDYEEQEYELLALKTGVPVSEIGNALMAFDILFPMNSSWFIDIPYTRIRALRLFPVPFRGVGADYRRAVYTKGNQFDELSVRGQYTHRELGKWSNVAAEVLALNGS